MNDQTKTTETTTEQKLAAILERVERRIQTRHVFEYGYGWTGQEWDGLFSEEKQEYKDPKVQAAWKGWNVALDWILDVAKR